MKKANKVLISVIADIFYVLIFDCIYGFFVGGRIGFYGDFRNNILYFVFVAVMAFIAMVFNFIFICEKDSLADKKNVKLLVIFTVLTAMTMAAIYSPLNSVAAGADSIVYDSTIIDVYYYKSLINYDISFIDNNGEEVSTTICFGNAPCLDENYVVEEGTKITVIEKNGGFDFPVYDITFVFDE